MRFEFDDSILVNKIVGNIIKSEVKTRQKIAREKFDQIHKIYLKQSFKPKKRAEYDGKYLLICSDGCSNSYMNTNTHFELAETVEQVRAVFDLHIGHDFVLIHESIVKQRPVRKLLEVKELFRK